MCKTYDGSFPSQLKNCLRSWWYLSLHVFGLSTSANTTYKTTLIEKEPYYEKTTTTTYKPTEYETTTTYKPKEYESTTTYKPKEYTTTTTYKPTEYETKPPTKYEKPAYTTKKYVYTTPKYYEGQTVKSEYEKPESFKKHIPEGIDAPKPKPYYETEKPYVPLELTTPNVSYYLPNYKPVNPEIPVVHGIPNAPKPKVGVITLGMCCKSL